jgi:polysaccharide export outer membrane protein
VKAIVGIRLLSAVFVAASISAFAQDVGTADASSAGPGSETAPSASREEYLLGPNDQIKVWALGVEEISDRPFRLDPAGFIDLPLIGRIQASGMSAGELKETLLTRLAKDVRHPQVSIEILDYGSQPVSVMGAVGSPGVHQLRGRKTLAEVVALAGGFRSDAGPVIKITRLLKWGTVPLGEAKVDASGEYSIGELSIRSLLDGENPAANILIRPSDVLTVPTAQMVYVIGEVRKPGKFPLVEQQNISVLEVLSMAEGFASTAAPASARILRTPPGATQPTETAVDLKKIMSGKAQNITLQANDILFVPSNSNKKAATKALDAIISTATGVVIFRRP